ncbi:uncharacterized protein TNCV_1050941 [Trichonephila clavipes]|nr:uncharacterized protein TNCV_1050941 [Trichonephila clavipes]
MEASSSSFIPTPLAHVDNLGEEHPRKALQWRPTWGMNRDQFLREFAYAIRTAKDQDDRHTGTTDIRGPLIRSTPSSWTTAINRTKRGRKETLAYKRSLNSESGGPEKKQRKGPRNKGEKRQLTLSSNNELHNARKTGRVEEIVMSSTSGYNLRPRTEAKVESQPTNEKRTQQEGPVRARGSQEHQYSPYKRRASKVSSSEDQKQRWSTTALSGEERTAEGPNLPRF